MYLLISLNLFIFFIFYFLEDDDYDEDDEDDSPKSNFIQFVIVKSFKYKLKHTQ